MAKNQKYVMTNQTTMSLYDVYELCEYAKTVLPNIEIEKETCTATKIRQEAIKNIDQDVDIIIIVGDPHSNNTQKLSAIAKKTHHCDVYMIESIDELQLEWLQGKQYAAISSGASTPTYLTNQIIAFLTQFDENDPATKEQMEALWQLWDKNFNRIAFTSGYENIDRADDAAVTMYVSFQNGNADDFTIARQAFCDGIERLKTLESFTLNGIL